MPAKLCKDCSGKLGFFKKKFQCRICRNHFCNPCLSKVKENEEELSAKLNRLTGHHCLTCVVLYNNEIIREQLFLLGNKQLAEYLSVRDISTTNCTEKYHLIDLVMEFAERNGFKSGMDMENELVRRDRVEELRRQAELLWQQDETNTEQDNAADHSLENQETTENSPHTEEEGEYSGDSPDHSANNVDENTEKIPTSHEHTDGIPGFSQSNPSEAPNETTDETLQQSHPEPSARVFEETSLSLHLSPNLHQAHGKWRSMEDVKQEEDIGNLSVLELKQILTANFIDYRGCCEKKELTDKVKMLYRSERKVEEDAADTKDNSDGASYERDLCKICMDHMIDCVLLDCGHLVSCTKCGKRLAQCPICRCLVVRVVHIFRV